MTLWIQPRTRLYGSPGIYASVARDVLFRRVNRGDDVARLEDCFARKVGATYALAMPQCRVGIYLALRHLLGEKKKVILTAYTLHDVVNMVVCAGGEPVFADIERETCNADPADVVRLIDDETGVVLMTHLHGLACPMERIAALCKRRNVPLVEDVAQAFGAKINGKWLGTFGAAGVYSFGVYKNVNSIYGGMLTTDDRQLAETIRDELRSLPLMRTSFFLKRFMHCLVGEIANFPPVFSLSTFWLFRYGYLHDVQAIKDLWGRFQPKPLTAMPASYLRRMTPMQARLVHRQLDRVDPQSQDRILRARLYHQGLSSVSDIGLPPMREDGAHIYLTYPIQVLERRKLVSFLMNNRRDLMEQHYRNNADMPWFARYYRDCPNARLTADQVILLPNYPGYRRSQVRENVRLIRRYYGVS